MKNYLFHHQHPIVLSIWLLFAMMSATMANGVTVSAQLDRTTMAVGQAALLTVTIKGDNNAQVDIPDIDGLFIEGRGQSTSIQIINGQMSSSVTRRYVVRPEKVGTYNIAPITVESHGKKLTVKNKISLKVTQGQAIAQRPHPKGKGSAAPTEKFNTKDLAHLEIVGLKEKALVGELIPVEIRAYFKNDSSASLAGINSKPDLDSSAFTVKFSTEKARQGRTTVDGKSYFVVIFQAAISPIKPGEFKLPFSMDATMSIRSTNQRRRRRANDPFGDAFFDDFFTRSARKNITLTSPPVKMVVTPPPTDGQPPHFDGAVGRFTINASAPTDPIRAGDPLTLTVRVSGDGNLARLNMPHMSDPSGWKSYPPKDHLESENDLGTSGIKVFEQTIVPRNTSVKEIPSMELVFFDPEKQTYETVTTPAIPIQVLPGTDVTDDDTSSLAQSDSDHASDDASPFRANMRYLGWLRKGRLDQSTWFIATATTLPSALILFSAFLLWTRRYNTESRQASALKNKQLKADLEAMDAAITSNDPQAFFSAARHAIQLHWAEPLGMQPDAVTLSDLQDPDACAVVEMAENLAFSGESANSIDLPSWKSRTLDAINQSQTQSTQS